jgi:hypothetical protein
MQIKITDNEPIETLSVYCLNDNKIDDISIDIIYHGKNKYTIMKIVLDMIEEISKVDNDKHK